MLAGPCSPSPLSSQALVTLYPPFLVSFLCPSAVSTNALHTNSLSVHTLHSIIFIRKWKA